MMTDIVGRLRRNSTEWGDLYTVAADEIERLTAEVDESERQTRTQLTKVIKRDALIKKLEAAITNLMGDAWYND